MATPEHICARPSLLTPTRQGNQKSFALARPDVTKEPGSFALCVRTDDYRRDDGSDLDIHSGDALIFKAASLEERETGIRPRAGDCVLARRRDSHGWLVLLEATEDGGTGLRDLASGETAEKESFRLLGILHERRRSYRGDSYEGEYHDPRDDGSVEIVALARMTVEETLADGESVVWAMCMVGESPLFADLRAEFVAGYDRKPGDDGHFDSTEEARDHALRLLCGQMFRAGQLAQ
jgi:hypothetical protein